eukprot:TRINITY_DN2834_c7_g1_i1.p1 TRINITY_DN2834_c7_g1~~TRINITY_DN2834_c7_g1_i1.p1  ORF type:complete len:477 (+),score=44.91 TRINITY_DN2834_c7_g1_i1:170-1600(+)
MGAFLASPVTSKVVERHSGGNDAAPYYDIGVASMTGWRATMEDAHLVHEKGHCVFFGVFDGHGGAECSQFLRDRFPEILPSNRANLSPTTIHKMVLELDKEFLEAFTTTSNVSGSTGTFIIATSSSSNQQYNLTAVNVGDSRIILSNIDEGVVVKTQRLTNDHRPTDIDELRRIEAASGTVFNDRVNGDLAISRAFGDGRFKKGGSDCTTHQVTAVPDIISATCKPGDILVTCCDGVFENDCFSEESLMSFIAKHLSSPTGTVDSAAAAVCDHAIENGSHDNITCMVSVFGGKTPPPSITKKLIPGPLSRPESAKFMAAYDAVAKSCGVSLENCVEMRFNEISETEREAEFGVFNIPEQLKVLPNWDPERVAFFKEKLSQEHEEEDEEDDCYEECHSSSLSIPPTDLTGLSVSPSPTPWGELLQCLEDEVQSKEEEQPTTSGSSSNPPLLSSFADFPDDCSEGSELGELNHCIVGA